MTLMPIYDEAHPPQWSCSYCGRPLLLYRLEEIRRAGVHAYCSDYCKRQHEDHETVQSTMEWYQRLMEEQKKTNASLQEWYQRLQEARRRIKQEQSEHTARWALCDW